MALATRTRGRIVNALTFDVEEWYQGLSLPPGASESLDARVHVGLERALSVLADAGVTATFFVLGQVAERWPDLVLAIAQAGHEIGTHGWSHTPIYQQTRTQFRAELQRSLDILQTSTGRPVLAHRAAFFSITRHTLWAFDELARAGVVYDSSVFPVHNYRYGIPNAPRFPYLVADGAVVEVPISTLRVAGLNLPFAGGFYARLLPGWALQAAVRQLNQAGQPAIAYFHPWELDPVHPRPSHRGPRLARATHYHGLTTTLPKLQSLLPAFRWAPISQVADAAFARSAPSRTGVPSLASY